MTGNKPSSEPMTAYFTDTYTSPNESTNCGLVIIYSVVSIWSSLGQVIAYCLDGTKYHLNSADTATSEVSEE